MNTNFLKNNNFQLEFARLPNVEFHVKNVDTPAVSGSPVLIGNPFNPIPFTSDSPSFEPLTVTFFIDEDLNTYRELFAWWTGVNFPQKWDQYKELSSLSGDITKSLYTDASLIILNSNRKPKLSFNFRRLFPINIGGLNLSYETAEDVAVICTATFSYQDFDIKLI